MSCCYEAGFGFYGRIDQLKFSQILNACEDTSFSQSSGWNINYIYKDRAHLFYRQRSSRILSIAVGSCRWDRPSHGAP